MTASAASKYTEQSHVRHKPTCTCKRGVAYHKQTCTCRWGVASAGARAGATPDHARAGASKEAKQAMQAEQAEQPEQAEQANTSTSARTLALADRALHGTKPSKQRKHKTGQKQNKTNQKDKKSQRRRGSAENALKLEYKRPTH